MFAFFKKKERKPLEHKVLIARRNRTRFSLLNFFKKKPKLVNKTNQNTQFRRSIDPRTKINRAISHFINKNKRLVNVSIALLLLTIVGIVILALYLLIRNPLFSITEIEVLGNNTISTDNIISSAGDIKNQSIFTIKTDVIETKIQLAYPNIYKINVSKYLPNKIRITILEKEPKLLLVNLNGAYVLDENANIVDIIHQEDINYPEDRLDIAAGIADENSKIIREVFEKKYIEEKGLQNLSPEEQKLSLEKNFNYTLITPQEKFNEFKKLRNTIINEIDALIANNQKSIQSSDFAILPQALLYDNTKYEKLDTVDKNRLELTLELMRYFSKNPYGYILNGRPVWKGEIIVELKFSNGKTIKFGVLKKPSTQLEDFEIMTNKLNQLNNNFNELDLSSENISVK